MTQQRTVSVAVARGIAGTWEWVLAAWSASAGTRSSPTNTHSPPRTITASKEHSPPVSTTQTLSVFLLLCDIQSHYKTTDHCKIELTNIHQLFNSYWPPVTPWNIDVFVSVCVCVCVCLCVCLCDCVSVCELRDLRENYCRNPDGRDLPWCFTTDPNIPVAYCSNIPHCGVEGSEPQGEILIL